MNRIEILEEFSSCTEQTIVKGKRSKRRLRPSSSSASSSGEFVCNSSPASTSTPEDEDMANCLILLARGAGFRATSSSDEEAAIKSKLGKKLVTRKFDEMCSAPAPAAAAKVGGGGGACDYECKTCSRTFPSFQALGGHRASHKKPKQAIVSIADDRKKSPPPISAQLIPPAASKIGLLKVENKLLKIHECSICGSEFGSGQALGGHMRRHRSVPVTNSSATSSHDEKTTKNMMLLNLDLNLPATAPPEEDFRGHFPANQQPRIVFPAAALVDCHY